MASLTIVNGRACPVVRKPLDHSGAARLNAALRDRGIRVEIDAIGHVQMWPMRDVVTRTEVEALAAVMAVTDAPIDWNRRPLPSRRMSALPKWVLDLVMDIQAHTDHPTLLFESGGFDGTAQYEWCPCNALALVPQDIRDQAEAIAAYRLQTDKEPAP